MYVGSRKIEQRNKLRVRNRDTDVENRHVDTAGEGKGGMNW